MKQLEFDFLGMPKYQLDLGLDYTQPQITLTASGVDSYVLKLSKNEFSFEPIYKVDLDKVPFTVKQEKMPWYRRAFYKLLGIKTE